MISKLSAALTFCPTTDPEVVHTQEKATMISLQYIQYQIFMLDTLLMLHVNSISIKLEEKKSILNKKHERSPKLVLQVLYYYISCEIRDALSPSKHHSYRVSYSIPHYGYTPELQQLGGCCLVAKSCLFCDPMDCSPPGSSVRGISQTRILERTVISFSRGPSWPWDQTQISCIGRWVLYHWATKEAPQQRLDGRKIYFPLDHIWSSLSKL